MIKRFLKSHSETLKARVLTKILLRLASETLKARVVTKGTHTPLLRDPEGQGIDQETIIVSLEHSESQNLYIGTLKPSLKDSDGKRLDQETL